MKSSIIRKTLVGLCAIALMLTFGGCDGDSAGRLVCEVVSVNGGHPLVSSYQYVTSSGDIRQRLDSVPVSFHARPYGCTVTTPCGGGPYTTFIVTSYDIYWQNVEGVEVDLTLHNVIGAHTNIMVPVHETSSGSVLIVGKEMKESDWFRSLGIYPLPLSFEANARLIFHGHESGSSRKTSIETGLRVMFLPSLIED